MGGFDLSALARPGWELALPAQRPQDFHAPLAAAGVSLTALTAHIETPKQATMYRDEGDIVAEHIAHPGCDALPARITASDVAQRGPHALRAGNGRDDPLRVERVAVEHEQPPEPVAVRLAKQ